MSLFPIEYVTKSNQQILIREAVCEDAGKLLQLKMDYLKNTETIPLFNYEYKRNIEEEKELIERYSSEKNSVLLVAIYDNTIIGNIDLTGSSRRKTQHTSVIGMGIHEDWRSQGVGTFLIQSVLNWAGKNELLKIIWLEVYASNSSGIALYKKMGFIESGLIPNFFLEKDKYIDKITMFLKI